MWRLADDWSSGIKSSGTWVSYCSLPIPRWVSSSEQSDEQELKSRLFFTVSASMKLESKSAESKVLRSDDSSSSSLISSVDSRILGRRHRQLASSSSPSSRIADSPSTHLVLSAGNQLLQLQVIGLSPKKPPPPTSLNFNVIFRQFSIYSLSIL